MNDVASLLLTTADTIALERLSSDYAFFADECDAEAFSSTFLPDGELTVHYPTDHDEPSSRFVGREELGTIPTALRARFRQTFHVVGQCAFDNSDGRVTGTVLCVAHHLRSNGSATTDLTMYLRYADVYGRDGTGGWKIASRVGRVHFTELRDVIESSGPWPR